LIPRAPRSRQRVASSTGVQVEPHERDDAAFRSSRKRERAVVCCPEGRVPVGLVEAEHEAARHPVPVHLVDQVLIPADHAVDVLAEVNVGVEHFRVFGQLAPQLLVPPGEHFPCAIERLHAWSLVAVR